MSRVHPITNGNDIAIFDPLTDSAVLPLVIKEGVVSEQTMVFPTRNKGGEIGTKLADMLHAMDKNGAITQSSDGQEVVLNCAGIFKEDPFNIVSRIDDFDGIAKVDWENGKLSLFQKVENPPVIQWETKETDKFTFKKDGRHPQSSHKIFSGMLQGDGFVFGEILSHEATMILSVDNMSEGFIGNLPHTFVGRPAQNREQQMVQFVATHLFPYIWGKTPVLNMSQGIRHKFQTMNFVCERMVDWANQIQADSESPVVLKVHRGRGKNHTPDVSISITHQLVELKG